MPNFNGLLEAGLFVENLSRARDFYQQVLGLEKLRESDAGCVFLLANKQVLLLISREKATVPSQTPGGEVPPCSCDAGKTLGAGHVAFAVGKTELDAWRAHLESHGVELLSEVAWQGEGRSLYFRDPDGHLLEIATPGLWGLKW